VSRCRSRSEHNCRAWNLKAALNDNQLKEMFGHMHHDHAFKKAVEFG
jgi:hypothetical protein